MRKSVPVLVAGAVLFGCATNDGSESSGMQAFQKVLGVAGMAVGLATKNDDLANNGASMFDGARSGDSSSSPAGSAGSAGATQVAADSPNQVIFRVTSNHPNKVQISYYSQTRRGQSWPGGDQAYSLNDSLAHSHVLSCNAGEKICYGAWVTGQSSPYWGG